MSNSNRMEPITISLCMIVKNEEETLARCLRSVEGIVDEIIIVDTGSEDKTKEIASQFTDAIFDFKWIDDFAAARNYAFSHASKKYVFWLDADDIILPQDREKLLRLKSTLAPNVDAVSMLYNLAFNEQEQVTFQIRRNRLVLRERNFRWVGAVHEYLEVYGNSFTADIAVTHLPLSHDAERNLAIYEHRLLKGEQFSPRDLYYFANELKDHRLYNRAIEYYQKFLKTNQGWVVDNIDACAKLADCFYDLHDDDNQLKYLFLSFKYGVPRSDLCCRLGFHYLSNNQLDQAIFWYKTATQPEVTANTWGMSNIPCQTWLPHLQLCVCYSKVGKYDLAYQHNKLAAAFIPNDPRIQHNKEYLEGMLPQSTT